jgi:hypothetical protein
LEETADSVASSSSAVRVAFSQDVSKEAKNNDAIRAITNVMKRRKNGEIRTASYNLKKRFLEFIA